MNFKEIDGLSHTVKDKIAKLGFTEPTLIQSKSIPFILKGKDVIGESATGSGKTLAFGIGMQHLTAKKGVQALVLTPTRELAEQVKDMLQKLTDLTITAVYGGVSINPQIEALYHTEVVVATPGRLLDHLQRGTIDLRKVKLLILDEADRMLDMGFIEDVENIVKSCPKSRQTLFFSATMPDEIKRLAQKYMKNPEKVAAQRMVDPKKLKQVYYDVEKNMKLALAIHLLKKEEAGLVMLFCNTRRNVDFVTKNLKANKIPATAIHGGLSQNKRSRTLQTFNDGKVEVLVCTDVAARGLDINDVSHVYNYDIPADSKDYVHRIGRTARAGENGKVINLLCNFDHDNFSRIMRDYDFNVQRLKRPYVEKVIIKTGDERRGSRGFNRGNSRGRSNQGNRTPRRSSQGNRRSSQNKGRFSNSKEGEEKIPVHLQL